MRIHQRAFNLQGILAICFLASFAFLIALLSWLRLDLSLRTSQISDFLVGPYSIIAKIAFVCLSLGACTLAYLIYAKSRKTSIALFVYSITCLTAGVTNPHAVLHDFAALTAFASIPLAIGFTNSMFAHTYTWVGLILLSFIAWPVGAGFGERLTVFVEILWLFKLSIFVIDSKQ